VPSHGGKTVLEAQAARQARKAQIAQIRGWHAIGKYKLSQSRLEMSLVET